jgi:hypothetical protein
MTWKANIRKPTALSKEDLQLLIEIIYAAERGDKNINIQFCESQKKLVRETTFTGTPGHSFYTFSKN